MNLTLNFLWDSKDLTNNFGYTKIRQMFDWRKRSPRKGLKRINPMFDQVKQVLKDGDQRLILMVRG